MIDNRGTVISCKPILCIHLVLLFVIAGCAAKPQAKPKIIELETSSGKVEQIPLKGLKSDAALITISNRIKKIDKHQSSWENSLRKVDPDTAKRLRLSVIKKRDAAIADISLAYRISHHTSGPLDERLLLSANENVNEALRIVQSDPRSLLSSKSGGRFGTLWNIWAEKSPTRDLDPVFEPVPYLTQGKHYLVALDLSAISYGKSEEGTYTQVASSNFSKFVDELLTSGRRRKKFQLTIVLIVDLKSFERPEKAVSTFEVNLEKIRKYRDKGGVNIDKDPFEIMRQEKDPDFVFGRTTFRIKTRSNQPDGFGAISLSLWADNRPLDEISVRLCIRSDLTKASKCQGISRSQYSLKGVDSLRVASEESPFPDAALHFLELGAERVYGVFWNKDLPNSEYITWSLGDDMKPDSLRKYLMDWGEGLVKTRENNNELRKRGKGLYNVLFPPDQIGARNAFEAFIKPYLQQDPTGNDYKAPSIFVRLIQQNPDAPLIIPLGLMAVSIDKQPAKFLGFHFRIETPLEFQSYKPSNTCLSRWVTLFPPYNHTDTELRNAFMRMEKWVPIWKVNTLKPFEDMSKFGDWVDKEIAEKDSMAVVILSHHSRNRIYFEESRKLVMSRDIVRKFNRPSMVILDGCGTGSPGAIDFVRQFNRNGVGTIIATSAEVDAYMAGDFLDCLGTVLEKNKQKENFDVATAYFKTLQLLRKRYPPPPFGNVPYGSRVLEYTLIGNGNIRLCLPKK